MNLLLDTHVILWALSDDPKLPREAKKLILDESNTIYYSIASVWEVAIKHINKPSQMLLDDEEFSKACIMAGFRTLPITEKNISALKTLTISDENAPEHHDPFDRLLLAQAKTEQYTFITHDNKIKYYNEACVMIV